MSKLRLGVLASGRGSNFKAILAAIQRGRLDAEVCVLISNKNSAGVLSYATQSGIPAEYLSRNNFASHQEHDAELVKIFNKYRVNFVLLAGYLKFLTPELINYYPNRILNIHPALLPSFGGEGMYGVHVHNAVLKHGCKISGATVHLVDEIYDHGPIILQKSVPVFENDTEETLAARVLKVEHEIFPIALQLFAENRIRIHDNRALICKK